LNANFLRKLRKE